MSDAPASDAAVLACSRCDGPVSQEDLVEGFAVRVDGQPVCALCIETLPPAVRVQINRVRALKGLAVTTYRMLWPAHPQAHRFTFTSAGLLLLHRRALVHGTEFPTPELPSGGRVPPPQAAQPPKAKRSPVALLLVACAGIAVIAGVGGLIAVSSAKPAAPTKPPVAVAPDPTPTATQPAPSSTPRLETPTPASDAKPVRSATDYLVGDTTAIQALLAAEADGAAPEVTARLIDLVRADRDTQLRRARQFLDKDQPEVAAKQLDQMRIPPGRAEFQEQEDAELALRTQIQRRRATATTAVPPTPSPVPEPVVAVPVVPAVVPTVPTTHPDPTAEPPVPVPIATKPPAVIVRGPHLELWTGPLGPQNQLLLEADGRSKVPSPWPFFSGAASPRFAPAVEVRGADKKERFTLQLTMRNEFIRNGGIAFSLHPFTPKRKELVITLPDAPAAGEIRVAFADSAWTPVSLPLTAGDQPSVQVQIADSTYTGSDPFWLGGVVQIADGAPSAEHAGLLPAGLLTADPIFEPTPLLRLLKAAAKARGEERKWSDPKVITIDDGIKVLAAGKRQANDKQKDAVYDSLKLRAGVANVDYLFLREEVTDPEHIADLMARTTSPKLDAARPLVVLIPDGSEAEFDPDEWSKRVNRISQMLVEGPNPKVRGGWIPVWVIGRLDGSASSAAAWSKARSVLRVPMIDLAAGQPRTQQQAVAQLTESLRTLMHQLRWVQINHAGK